MAIKIVRGSDPFKKYWWAILLIFAVIGAWVCLPLLGGTGSGSVASGEGGLKSADQSLDAVNNPSGAPGHAVGLAMDNTGPYKKHTGPITDSLYQAPPDNSSAAAPASAAATSGGGTLADALKDVASKASAQAARSGAASVAFNPSHASFGSMSGLSGGSSGSSASAGFSSSGGGVHLNAFGSENANVGVAYTKGLGGGGGSSSSPRSGAAQAALQNASSIFSAAAHSNNMDVAANMTARSFDGGKAGGGLVGGPGGGSGGGAGIGGQTPIDLKPSINDYTKLDQRRVQPVPPVTPKPAQPDMGQMIMQMIMSAVVSGLIGGALKGMTGGTAKVDAPIPAYALNLPTSTRFGDGSREAILWTMG